MQLSQPSALHRTSRRPGRVPRLTLAQIVELAVYLNQMRQQMAERHGAVTAQMDTEEPGQSAMK